VNKDLFITHLIVLSLYTFPFWGKLVPAHYSEGPLFRRSAIGVSVSVRFRFRVRV